MEKVARLLRNASKMQQQKIQFVNNLQMSEAVSMKHPMIKPAAVPK